MKLLSREDSTILRGLAILLIIFHNFTHWLPRCIDENEYTWSIDRIQHYWLYIQQGGPHVILNFFSHYGHYGVAMFLFLSGYGLVMKYEKGAQVGVLDFLESHARKLWKLMLPAIVIFYLMFYWKGGRGHSWDEVIQMATFVVNINPHRPLLLGPWWWFSLMMQFYIVYRLFIYRRSRFALIFVTVLCLAAQLWATYESLGMLANSSCIMTYLHYNFPCSMLAFASGVWMARYGADWMLSPWTALGAAVLVILGSFNVWIWSFSGLFAIIVMLQVGRLLGKIPVLSLVIAWVGVISAWVFALHPIVRAYTIDYARHGFVYSSLAVYVVITLSAAWLMHYALKSK